MRRPNAIKRAMISADPILTAPSLCAAEAVTPRRPVRPYNPYHRSDRAASPYIAVIPPRAAAVVLRRARRGGSRPSAMAPADLLMVDAIQQWYDTTPDFHTWLKANSGPTILRCIIDWWRQWRLRRKVERTRRILRQLCPELRGLKYGWRRLPSLRRSSAGR
jgi:hypothetical protein